MCDACDMNYFYLSSDECNLFICDEFVLFICEFVNEDKRYRITPLIDIAVLDL